MRQIFFLAQRTIHLVLKLLILYDSRLTVDSQKH